MMMLTAIWLQAVGVVLLWWAGYEFQAVLGAVLWIAVDLLTWDRTREKW